MNLQVLDVTVELLSCPLSLDLDDWQHLSQVFKAIYQVLHTYTTGRSKKNALYFAKYIDFFTTQLSQPVSNSILPSRAVDTKQLGRAVYCSQFTS